jgi:hypothetical protein
MRISANHTALADNYHANAHTEENQHNAPCTESRNNRNPSPGYEKTQKLLVIFRRSKPHQINKLTNFRKLIKSTPGGSDSPFLRLK